MNQVSWSSAVLSGVIGVVIGLVATYVVSLIRPTTELQWSFIAVGIASFCSAFAGYIRGVREKG